MRACSLTALCRQAVGESPCRSLERNADAFWRQQASTICNAAAHGRLDPSSIAERRLFLEGCIRMADCSLTLCAGEAARVLMDSFRLMLDGAPAIEPKGVTWSSLEESYPFRSLRCIEKGNRSSPSVSSRIPFASFASGAGSRPCTRTTVHALSGKHLMSRSSWKLSGMP